jgi:hypothetical protein
MRISDVARATGHPCDATYGRMRSHIREVLSNLKYDLRIVCFY